MDLLRFITAGSVDDGKSTLIGRLLYDSKNILIDQLEALEKSTKNRTDGSVDQAYLARTDKLYGGDRTKWRDLLEELPVPVEG